MGIRRREQTRAAFKRLDVHCEGQVDISVIENNYNVNRHPEVVDGSRKASEILDEFLDTLHGLVAFRRGEMFKPNNTVTWEEFEDYFKCINGCFQTDEVFCGIMQKVWNLDKTPNASVEARSALASPAAGIPAKSRAGLHHWQSNTLPSNMQYRSVNDTVDIDQVMHRMRANVARQGLRWAIEVVKNFHDVDDDLDNMIDTYEFRKAVQQSGLRCSDEEEARIFEVCGAAPGRIDKVKFLDLLHGELNAARFKTVKQVFESLGGTSNQSATIDAMVLKERFNPESHPEVTQGSADSESLMKEFLETFSLLVEIRHGGCIDGTVSFDDFVHYYTVFSSTIEHDAHFDLLLNRLWKSQLAGGKPTFNRQFMNTSPMAEPRPPVFDAPSAYSTSTTADHRRYARKEGEAPLSARSPITKSGIVLGDGSSSEIQAAAVTLRRNLAKKGMKGWRLFLQKLKEYDHRKNGTVTRLDWNRLNKLWGLGLSPEECETIFKGLAYNRSDGCMSYEVCLQKVKGPLPAPRKTQIQNLFNFLSDGSRSIPSGVLASRFYAEVSPPCLVGRQKPAEVRKEFTDAVDFFCSNELDEDEFLRFFHMVSALYEQEDEFTLMVGPAFGISSVS